MVTGNAQGFTLLELVTVIILISILSLVLIIQWPGDSVSLSAQADQLVGDIRYTQSLALTRNQRYRINFAANRYWITNRDGTVPVPHPMNGATTIFLASGVSLASTQTFLVFDENSAPYTNALIPGTALASDAVITLSAGGNVRAVRISPETGRTIKQ